MQVSTALIIFSFIIYSNGQGVVEIERGRCNNKQLANIMKQTMTSNIEQSMNAIEGRAKNEVGGHFGVVCSQDDLASAIFPTEIFCEATLSTGNGYTTCLAFKRG